MCVHPPLYTRIVQPKAPKAAHTYACSGVRSPHNIYMLNAAGCSIYTSCRLKHLKNLKQLTYIHACSGSIRCACAYAYAAHARTHTLRMRVLRKLYVCAHHIYALYVVSAYTFFICGIYIHIYMLSMCALTTYICSYIYKRS